MRLSARTRRLERSLPPMVRTPPTPPDDSGPLTSKMLEYFVELGCERHLEDGELGKVTVNAWFHRLSGHELVLIEEAARRCLSEEDAATRAERLP